MKVQTYTDVIKSLLERLVILPPELLSEVESFVEDKKNLGYTTREEFFRDATRWRLKSLSEGIECVEVSREMYEKTKIAIKEMDLPFLTVRDFVDEQMKELHEQHAQWKAQMEETEEAEE
jgi:hypothetical protein